MRASAWSDAPEDFARSSLAALDRQSAEGQAAGAVVLALLEAAGGDAPAVLAGLAAGEGGEAGGLYGVAARLDAAGRTEEAVAVLAVLAGTEEGGHEGMLGLAVIAARQGRIDEALTLASACLEAGERHPRACAVAGIGELERGNKAAAQSYLATASRIARRRDEYRGELRVAQRALLLMHLD